MIIDAARRLDFSGVALNRLGIQFAQIGDDEDATEALKELDDEIAGVYGVRVRRCLCFDILQTQHRDDQDMVDTTPYNPNDARFTMNTMTKILLGAISSGLEALPNDSLKSTRRESR